jgi:hypothetical protein
MPTRCAGNLQGTWFYTQACGDDPLADFRQLCSSVTLVSSNSTLAGRVDFAGANVARQVTTSFNTTVNLPTACASIGCSSIQSLLRQSVPTATCTSAASPRTGCDCTVTGTGSLDESGTFTNDGGMLTIVTPNKTRTFDTCVVVSGSGATMQVRETTSGLSGTERGTSGLTRQ